MGRSPYILLTRWLMLSLTTLIILGCAGPSAPQTDAPTDPINTAVAVNNPNDLAEPAVATVVTTNDPQNSAPATATDGTPIKIGSSLALTGPFGQPEVGSSVATSIGLRKSTAKADSSGGLSSLSS